MGMVFMSERKEEGFVHWIAAYRVQLRGSVATHLYVRHSTQNAPVLVNCCS